MSAPKTCQRCGRELVVGVSAWATDVKVITPEGVRREVRYTCEPCEAGE